MDPTHPTAPAHPPTVGGAGGDEHGEPTSASEKQYLGTAGNDEMALNPAAADDLLDSIVSSRKPIPAIQPLAEDGDENLLGEGDDAPLQTTDPTEEAANGETETEGHGHRKEKGEKKKKKKKNRNGEEGAAEGGEDDDVFDWDRISEDEENDRKLEELQAAGEEFSQWLGPEFHSRGGADALRTRVATVEEIEAHLERRGYNKALEAVVESPIPERLFQMDMSTRGTFSVGNKVCQIDRFAEACWIITRLVLPPLAPLFGDLDLTNAIRNGRWEHQAVFEVSTVLKLLHEDFVEPGRMMIDYQHEFPYLRKALWSQRRLTELSSGFASASAAYCTKSGRRQLPSVTTSGVHFSFLAGRPTGTEDTSVSKPIPRAQRKPADILLGRLLWNIADLDMMLHGFEKSRHQQLELLSELGPASQSIQWSASRLAELVFESSFDVASWQVYANHCRTIFSPDGGRRGSHYGFILQNGLGEFFHMYSLAAHQFAENVLRRSNVHAIPATLPNAQSPHHWAGRVGDTVNRTAHRILSLFNEAIVEILASHPVILRAVYLAYRSYGACVTRSQGRRDVKLYSLGDLFERNPVQYLSLLSEQEGGQYQVSIELADADIEIALANTQLFVAPTVASELHQARASVGPRLVQRLKSFVAQQIDTELKYEAELQILRRCQERIGAIAMTGPYEQTTLPLSGFPSQSPVLWEEEWNAIEAIPAEGAYIPRGEARVCGVYRGDNGVITFACCDQNGAPQGHVRWVDCAEGTVEGKERATIQKEALLQLLDRSETNVLTIAVIGLEASDLLRSLERFVQELVLPRLRYRVPVLFVAQDVPLAFSGCASARTEFPTADAGLKTAISCARYFRDPLSELCRVIGTNKEEDLTLPIGATYTANQAKVRSAIEREVSLWVGAVGVDLNRCLRQPAPETMLQFVPGFGSLKARHFVRELNESRGGIVHCRAQLMEMLQSQQFVAVSAVPSLRVILPLNAGGGASSEVPSTGLHILDCTLIPPHLYPAAEKLAMEALGQTRHPKKCIAKLWMLPESKRFTLLSEVPVDQVFDPKTVAIETAHFLWDELIAAGQSFMRRLYRNMSSSTYLRLSTGIRWIGRREKADLFEEEGQVLGLLDIVQGIPMGMRPAPIGSGEPPIGIRLQTQYGIPAMMATSDISDPTLRQVMNSLRGSQNTRLPPSLEHKPMMWGTIREIQALRGEMILTWMPPPPTEAALERGVRHSGTVSQNRDDDAMSAASIQTRQLVDAAKTNATKVSRHPMYRNNSLSAVDELVSRQIIGSYLLCPSSQDVHRVYFVLKVGEHLKPLHIGLREFHRSDGAIAYDYNNIRTSQKFEFEDPDHCFNKFIKKMISVIYQIRNSRNFVPDSNVQDILAALDDKVREEQMARTKKIPFVVAENVTSKGTHSTPYIIYYRVGSQTKHVGLVVETGLYLRHPSQNGGPSQYIACRDVDDVMYKVYQLSRKRRPEPANPAEDAE